MAVAAESSFEQMTRGLGLDENDGPLQQNTTSEQLTGSLLIDSSPLVAPKTLQPTRRRINGGPIADNHSVISFGTEQDSLGLALDEGDDHDDKKLQAAEAAAEEDDDVPKDNPRLAILYFVLYTIFSTYNLIAGKFFRTWYPGMSTFQLLFFRGFSAVLVMFMYMGRDAKRQLVDNVNVDNFPPLAFRIFQGIFSQFVRYYSMTFFSLSMIGVIQKLAPVFTVGLAYLILTEKLTGIEIMLNVVAIVASLLVTVGDHNQNGHQYTNNHYLALLFLIANPVFIGMSSIALRKMKKTSSETLTTWTNVVQSVFMATAMLCLNQSFVYYPGRFSMVDWVMLFGMTMSVIGAQTFKLMAFQNQAASKLQVVGNLQMVYQFLFDVFLFDTQFSELQYWGIGVTVLTFMIDIYLTVNPVSKPEEEDEQQQQSDLSGERESELVSLAHQQARTLTHSERARLISHGAEPLIDETHKRENSVGDAGSRTFSAVNASLSTQVSYKFQPSSGETVDLRVSKAYQGLSSQRSHTSGSSQISRTSGSSNKSENSLQRVLSRGSKQTNQETEHRSEE